MPSDAVVTLSERGHICHCRAILPLPLLVPMTKLKAAVEEAVGTDIRVIDGVVPVWCQFASSARNARPQKVYGSANAGRMARKQDFL